MAYLANQVNLFYGEFGMSPAQCRGARGLLNWSQSDLAERSGVGHKTIADFERVATTRPYGRTLAAIIAAFETVGIEFIKGGVRVRSLPKRTRRARN
jgi:transcriptional regulator with XRE-family HTH domain